MLFDIDKNNKDRGSPSPNHHDKLPAESVMARGTLSTSYTTELPDSTTGIQGIQLGVLTLVQVGTATITNDGSTLTYAIAAHNLGYSPIVIASLNNASVTGISAPVNVFLPTFTGASVGGVTSGMVTFTSWLQAFSDNTSVYFQFLNASGNPTTVTVTYYLYRQQAAQ